MDPVESLEEQAASRVRELVPIRYGRMLVSPFTFFRGAAYLMAADLADASRTGLDVQLCGDAHLSNFGVFGAPRSAAGVRHQRLRRDTAGPFRVGREAIDGELVAVAGRDRGFDPNERESINRAVTRSYRRGDQGSLADLSNLDLWYSRIDVDEIAPLTAERATRTQLKRFERNMANARSKNSLKAFSKLTPPRRRRAQDRKRPAADRSDRGHGVRRRTG